MKIQKSQAIKVLIYCGGCGNARAVRDDMPHAPEAGIHPLIRLRTEPLTLSPGEVTQLFTRPTR